MVEGYLAGSHRSKQRGSSIEFHEFRQYTPGDDLSQVDWRVFARNDKLFLRTFEQETNLECHIMLDCSASMAFTGESSSLSKLEYSSFFAACLSWLVISKTDRVSLTLFDEEIRRFIPPGSTRRHLNDLLSALENNQPSEGTSIVETLQRAHPLLKRKGTIILLSDFFCDPAELFSALNPYIHRGFRIHLFHILSPDEYDLGNRGLSRYVDLETSDQLIIHPNSIRSAWNEQIRNHVSSFRQLAAKRSVDYTMITTSDSYFGLFDRLRD